MRSGSSQWILSLSLALAALVLTLGAAELGARLLTEPVRRVNQTWIPRNLVQPSRIEHVPYLFVPGASGQQVFGSDPRGYFDPGGRLTYRINSLGFRGAETTREKFAGTVRIIGIGDSFLFGEGVRERDTLLAVLQRRLDENYGPTSFEVLNLGAGGYDTRAEVALLAKRGMSLDPDLVVICFFLNDANGPTTLPAFNPPVPNQPSWWRRHSRLASFLIDRFERKRAMEHLISSYRANFRDDDPRWISARNALKSARDITASRDVELVLMIFPMLWHLSDGYPFEAVHEFVAAAARELQIPVLDLLPEFRGYDGPELWVHPNNQHPNEIAHDVAGRALYAFLRDNQLIERPDAIQFGDSM